MLLGNAIEAKRACAIRTRQGFRFAARCLDLKICTCLLYESVEQSIFCEIPEWGFQPLTDQCAREEGSGLLLG